MKIIKINDRYNEDKVWIIKKYSNSTYFWNQEIDGKMFYSKFKRTTKKEIESTLEIKLNDQMNKERLFRELIKFDDHDIISIKHNYSQEVAVGEAVDLMYQFVIDMENIWNDIHNTYQLKIPTDQEIAKYEEEFYRTQEELESNFRYGF
ncbi:MAG: hypothetical protein ACFFG0_18840 [Candidatus Thorarchaeota archaeon]